jgi:copper transport protein
VTNRRMQLAAARRAACAAAVALIALVVVPAAAAHTTLVSTSPADDSVLAEPPNAVVLRFNEPVESAFGSIRVYDGNAARVDDGHVERPTPRTVRIGIARKLTRGTYTVTWRVTSEDSHPISGSFVFHVVAPGPNPGGIADQVLGGGTPRSISVLFAVTRFFDFALILLIAGGAVALASSLRSASPTLRRRLLAVVGVWATLLVLVSFAGIVLQGADAGGFGLGQALHWDSVSTVLDTRFGKVWFAEAVVAAVIAVWAFLDVDVRLVAAGSVLLVAGPSLSGHPSAGGGLTLFADLAHVAAAAVWTGGLAMVVTALIAAGPDRWPLAARAVPRFSRIAVVSVAVLIVAGVVNAYEEVGAWRGFWDTTYGNLLLVKIALVLPLLALGAYNNRYAVPRLSQEITTPDEQRRFLQVAGAELAIVVAVVAVTSVLVSEPPAKAAVALKGSFTSTVTRVTPQAAGLRARVLDHDARIGLRNDTRQTILVLGYTREPYLRFTPNAVYRNTRSPATYLNGVRLGGVDMPDTADAKAAPDWTRVAERPYYEWFDHRIHWMNPSLPPQVRRAETAAHRIFGWSVPIRVGGQDGSIRGRLDYAPAPG